MRDNPNYKNEPVCKFGPGGDFVSNWPKQSQIATKTPITAKTDITSGPQKNLFGDELQIPIHTIHKPNPRIRLHRRTPKKSIIYDVSDQGMLFEAEQKTVKTA